MTRRGEAGRGKFIEQVLVQLKGQPGLGRQISGTTFTYGNGFESLSEYLNQVARRGAVAEIVDPSESMSESVVLPPLGVGESSGIQVSAT